MSHRRLACRLQPSSLHSGLVGASPFNLGSSSSVASKMTCWHATQGAVPGFARCKSRQCTRQRSFAHSWLAILVCLPMVTRGHILASEYNSHCTSKSEGERETNSRCKSVKAQPRHLALEPRVRRLTVPSAALLSPLRPSSRK